jgi:hypothetical protein
MMWLAREQTKGMRGNMAHEWKIRSMSETISRAAVAAAERAKVTTAVWVGQAIQEKLAREHEVLTGGEVLGPGVGLGEGEASPASPVARPEVTLEGLIAIAATMTLPQWLRSGAARHIATTIHVGWPTRPPRKALQPPEAPAGEGEGAPAAQTTQAAPGEGEEVGENAGGDQIRRVSM